MKGKERDDSHFDVVICGAGLAGLSLARQLRLEQPDVSVALLDPQTRPLPEAAWKVGESTVEFGAHYLAEYLQLGEYLQKRHLVKLGLRFFFPGDGDFSARPEIGLRQVAPVKAFQIDRGILENDMREMAHADGTRLMEGCHVRRIELAENDAPHRIIYTDLASGADAALTARWVVDASGRRQILQRQLHLRRSRNAHACSSSWFRVAGRRDVGDLVPASNAEWHGRVPGRMRYYSTTHLVGTGYWVWLIPLPGEVTSVGIVARNDLHDPDEFNTFERACQWLARNEPTLAAYLGEEKPLDFRAMKNYSYSSERVYSARRWSCVGEAATFADPFYSPGTDLIAVGNTLTAGLIRRDRAGEADAGRADRYSSFMIGLNDRLTAAIQHGYAYLGDPLVSAMRSVWDYSSAWGHFCPQLFNRTFDDDAGRAAIRATGVLPLVVLAERMIALFDEWLDLRRRNGAALTYDFFNYLGLDWLAQLRLDSLRRLESVEALQAQYQANAELLEALVQAIFLIAVEDVLPAELHRLADVEWLNAQMVTLDPTKWETSGMLRPRTTPRPFRHLRDALRQQLRPTGEMTEIPADQDRHSLRRAALMGRG